MKYILLDDLVLILAAAGALGMFGINSAGADAPASKGTTGTRGTPTFTPTSTVPPCGLAWRVVPSPNVGTGANVLNGVGAVSSEDVWAVKLMKGS